jgi:hypothetical protein
MIALDLPSSLPMLRKLTVATAHRADASVGDWEGNERTVDFTTPVEAPAFIKRVIGRDAMRVVETQRRERLADGSATLSSTPVPDMPGGAKFATQAVLTFRTAPGGGACQVCAVAQRRAGRATHFLVSRTRVASCSCFCSDVQA